LIAHERCLDEIVKYWVTSHVAMCRFWRPRVMMFGLITIVTLCITNIKEKN